MAQDIAKREANGTTAVAERTNNSVVYTPRFDIVETDQELVLCGDLPGATQDSLDVRFENGELTIEAKVEPRHTNHEFVYGEYGVGNYYRSFTIGESIDADRISAELHQGVLTLHLPKSEAVKPRRIKVQAAK